MFIRGHKCSQLMQDVMRDLSAHKRLQAVQLSKQTNDFNLWADDKAVQSVEFLSTKNNASLFVMGAHNKKKRPHTLTVGRLFNNTALDFVELSVTAFKSIKELKGKGVQIGNKPMIAFHGDKWQSTAANQLIKNLLIDVFNAEPLDKVALQGGLDTFISCTMVSDAKIKLRIYSTEFKKS